MKFTVEVDKYNATSLTGCLRKIENSIPDFDEWRFFVNAGGIDYGIYLNIDTDKMEIEISNQPDNDDSFLEDVIEFLENEYCEDNEDDEEEEEE